MINHILEVIIESRVRKENMNLRVFLFVPNYVIEREAYLSEAGSERGREMAALLVSSRWSSEMGLYAVVRRQSREGQRE